MHEESEAPSSSFYLFSSREKKWALTALSAFSLLMAVKNLISPSPGWQFDDPKLHILGFVMEGFTAIVLSYWIAKSRNKLERAFIGLWLIGWAIAWFAPLYSDVGLWAVRYANFLIWLAATVIALRIMKAANGLQ